MQRTLVFKGIYENAILEISREYQHFTFDSLRKVFNSSTTVDRYSRWIIRNKTHYVYYSFCTTVLLTFHMNVFPILLYDLTLRTEFYDKPAQ